MIIALNIYTFVLFYCTLVFIGKFFCIKFFEDVYDAIDEDRDLMGCHVVVYCLNIVFTIIGWIMYYYDLGRLANEETSFLLGMDLFIVAFAALFNMGIVLTYTVNDSIVPKLKNIHYRIKCKKRDY